MKIQISLGLLGLVFCASFVNKLSSKTARSIQSPPLYKVYKIDSIHSYYLIYAKRNNIHYKIVSDKSPLGNCKSIMINHEYAFNLQSRNDSRRLSKIKLSPEALMRINCFYYDDSTFICLERDSISDLHSAKNVRGLCFLKDCKQTGIR